MTKTRSIFIVSKEFLHSINKSVVFWRVVSALLFVKVVVDQSRQCQQKSPPKIISPFPPVRCIHPVKYETRQRNNSDCNPDSAPTFWSLAVGVGTDKVELPPGIWPTELAVHNYQWAYEKYLRPKRCEPLKLMEMGLGCKMPYSQSHGSAEGRSIRLWLSFLPKASISLFEYDEACAKNWYKNDPHGIGRRVLDSRVKIVIGNQLSQHDLYRAISNLGPQDVIIDDGGHSMMMQQNSLRVLFPFIRPGGIYILEDLSTSFWGGFWQDKSNGLTMVDYISHIISGMHSPKHASELDNEIYPGLEDILPLIKSVDCFRELCVFQRWEDDEPGSPPSPSPLTFDQAAY